MCGARARALGFGVFCAAAAAARAQDLYDPAVLRTVHLNFHDPNWLQLLRDNYDSQTNILATLVVDGVEYSNVGVRIRGNYSYTALPPGSEKLSLNVEVDFTDPEQAVMGYSELNLNNGFRDPTFCREVVYNNYVAQFIPNTRANHVVLKLNGENWGVYVNVEQFNRRMLSSYFSDTSGMRIKCPNVFNGPGLQYVGPDAADYMDGYEIKDDGGLADPWGELIAVCDTVTNGPLDAWWETDERFAVDPSLWSLVLENVLTDEDGYVNEGADFMTYRNPTDGRMFLLQTDGNETFTVTSWSTTRNFNAVNKPVLSHVLAIPEVRARYYAHYRRVIADVDWAYFGPIFAAHRDLIDAAVQADPKKLYSYELFQQNFTSSVEMPYPGWAGGPLIGLQEFVENRPIVPNRNAQMTTPGPVISDVQPSDPTPDPFDPVSIRAMVTPAVGAIAHVELYYRANPTQRYQRVPMAAAGPNEFAAPLPIDALPGQRVSYYVAATAANAWSSLSFYPIRTESAPLWVNYSFGSTGGMRITEWMYSGSSGEFIEFTNLSNDPVDMTGWSLDDDHVVPGAFDLSALGVVAAGESVVVTESVAESYRAAWALTGAVKILGGLGVASGNSLGRNDEINLFGADGLRVDRLTYGDQRFPGTIRTQNVSGQACAEVIGQDEISAWQRSVVGDGFGSFASLAGEVGTPGSYPAPRCNPCEAPQIVAEPASQMLCPRAAASLAVVASGTGPLSFRWQVETGMPGSGTYVDLIDGLLNGVATVTAANSAVLHLSECVAGASARFRCNVSNSCGSDTSAGAGVTVWPSCLVGDMDCDGSIGVGDIGGFVLAISNPPAYVAAFPNCNIDNADVNDDKSVSVADIGPFVVLLVGS